MNESMFFIALAQSAELMTTQVSTEKVIINVQEGIEEIVRWFKAL
jgi:hypothetical protein